MFARLERSSTGSWLYVHTEGHWIEDSFEQACYALESLFPGFEVAWIGSEPVPDEDCLIFVDKLHTGAAYIGREEDMRNLARQGGCPQVIANERQVNVYPVPGEKIPISVSDPKLQVAYVETWPLKVPPLKWNWDGL